MRLRRAICYSLAQAGHSHHHKRLRVWYDNSVHVIELDVRLWLTITLGFRYNGSMHQGKSNLLDPDTCYQALCSHDARFDGAFFVAVDTTGVYCRPVCPARTPLPQNCSFYRTAAEAERAGYRPCLRCRPEQAPGRSRVDSTTNLARLVAEKIEDGALWSKSVTDLASDVGVTDRHLRRIVLQEFGVSPIELAQTQKLHTARQLLHETNLTITDIAFASGFTSLRRFHALFKERYHQAPGELRRRRPALLSSTTIRCHLSYRPPYDWQGMLHFLERRAVPGVEIVKFEDGGIYARNVALHDVSGSFKVRLRDDRNCLQVDISQSLAPALLPLLCGIRRMFDVNCQPIQISEHLGDLAAQVPGMRLPGCINGFEILVRAICGQQISVAAARTILGRLASRFGSKLLPEGPTELTYLFPSAAALASSEVSDIMELGIIERRAQTLVDSARACAQGEIDLMPSATPEVTASQLMHIKGIGEWTAQYVCMRALSWPDSFPASDLGIMKALGVTDPAEAEDIAESWRPWRAYAAMHLWRSLESMGVNRK